MFGVSMCLRILQVVFLHFLVGGTPVFGDNCDKMKQHPVNNSLANETLRNNTV